MALRNLMKKLAVIILISVLVVATIGLWQAKFLLEQYFEAVLEETGLENVKITIAQIGLGSATLNEISVGSETSLKIHDVTLTYTLDDLEQGRLDEIHVENVSIKIVQQENDWQIFGLEGLKSDASDNNPLSFLALSAEQVEQIPFKKLAVEESTIELLTSFGDFKLPFNLKWQKYGIPNFFCRGENITYAHDDVEASVINSQMSATLKDAIWTGDWTAEMITTNLPLPTLSAHGLITADTEHVSATGSLLSDDSAYKGNFTFSYAPETTTSGLRLESAEMPWKKGRLSVQDIWLPFESKEPIKIKLQVEHVDLAELMETLIGNRITAKGLVSGYITLIIATDGKITVQKGNLGAEAPGTIVMPPETIPADNQQINLVKDIMQDLHYDVLNISANPDKNGELSIKLTVEGKNPKVYNGRPVKLNINLTGNLLDFFEQNLMFLTEPETLLKGNQNHDK